MAPCAPRLALTVTPLVFALAGRGGATVAVQEVPGDPAPLARSRQLLKASRPASRPPRRRSPPPRPPPHRRGGRRGDRPRWGAPEAQRRPRPEATR